MGQESAAKDCCRGSRIPASEVCLADSHRREGSRTSSDRSGRDAGEDSGNRILKPHREPHSLKGRYRPMHRGVRPLCGGEEEERQDTDEDEEADLMLDTVAHNYL